MQDRLCSDRRQIRVVSSRQTVCSVIFKWSDRICVFRHHQPICMSCCGNGIGFCNRRWRCFPTRDTLSSSFSNQIFYKDGWMKFAVWCDQALNHVWSSTSLHCCSLFELETSGSCTPGLPVWGCVNEIISHGQFIIQYEINISRSSQDPDIRPPYELAGVLSMMSPSFSDNTVTLKISSVWPGNVDSFMCLFPAKEPKALQIGPRCSCELDQLEPSSDEVMVTSPCAPIYFSFCRSIF